MKDITAAAEREAKTQQLSYGQGSAARALCIAIECPERDQDPLGRQSDQDGCQRAAGHQQVSGTPE